MTFSLTDKQKWINQMRNKEYHKRRCWFLVTLFILTALALAIGGYGFYHQEMRTIRTRKLNDLQAIAELKTHQLTAWRSERLTDARMNSTGMAGQYTLAWLKARPDAVLEQAVRDRLEVLRQYEGYQNMILATPDGQPLLTLKLPLNTLEAEAKGLVARTVAERQPVFGDFFRCAQCQQIHLDVAAPIMDEQHQVQAILILRSDPEKTLYPLIQSWPLPRRSAETVLLCREGSDVLFLNRLRHRAAPPLSVRLPLTNTGSLSVQAVLGQSGECEGHDYRNVAVLADLRPIPGSAWFMVTKIDTDEILAEVHDRGAMLLILITLGILMTGGLMALFYNYRSKIIYKALYRAEQERRKAQEETRATLYGIGDGVIATDTLGRITRMNPVAATLTGWSETEALGHPLREIFRIINEETRATVENPAERVLREGCIVGLANHTLLIAKDGTERPIADSGAPIRTDTDEITGVVLVFRDQSAERAAQKALENREAFIKTVLDHLPVGIAVNSLDPPVTFQYMNDQFPAIYRTTRQKLATPDSFWDAVCEDPVFKEKIKKQVLEDCASGDAHRMQWQDLPLTRKGEETTYITARNIPLPDKGLMISIIWDVTERMRAEAALHASEQQYRSLIEGTPDIIMSFDPECRLLFVNASITPLTGMEPEVIVGHTPTELGFPTEYCTFWEDLVHRAVAIGEPIEAEFAVEIQQEKILFNWRLVPIKAAGMITHVIGIARDITKLRKSEQNYQMLFNEMLDGFALHEIICDEQGEPVDFRFLAVNPAFERITGMKMADVPGKTILQVLPNIEKSWIEIYGQVALTGEPAFFEKQAKEIGRHFQVTVFSPAAGQFACIFTDISERKRAEEALRESEARHSKMVANIGDVIAIIDKDDVNRYKSPNIERWFGWEPEDVVGAKTWDNIHPDDVEPTQKRLSTIGGKPNATITAECRYRCKDGHYKWIEYTAVNLLHDPDIQGILLNYHDISERKEAEQEQKALQAQLLQSQKMESVGRLAGGVAHDFNNMLGVIIGHTDMALDETDAASPLHDDLEEIQKAALRSADLTRQLLAFARKQTVRPRVLDLNQTVTSMLKMLKRLIGENINLEWQPSVELWPVRIDPSQVDQILANLAVNARDAITGVGRLSIKTENVVLNGFLGRTDDEGALGDYVLLAVSDTGAGMTPETLEHVFEPFFTTKEVGQGTGLGLAMVYGAVKQNQGYIDVASTPGQGTTFKIYLPQAEAPTATDDPVQTKPARGSETVLLTEDEEAILNLGTAILKKHGYEVLSAHTPAEALAMAERHEGPIHLLVTDVVMPQMNGKELKDRLTTLRPNIKTLFMSGYTSDVIAHQGIIDEGVKFLQKPFSMNTLTQKVHEMLHY